MKFQKKLSQIESQSLQVHFDQKYAIIYKWSEDLVQSFILKQINRQSSKIKS